MSAYDVLVLGAGPAGSALARRLASAGARVALIGAASRPGIEGVSERSRALLLEEGLAESSPPAPAGIERLDTGLGRGDRRDPIADAQRQ